MSDVINGRTPEEIKRNLSYLVRCENCPQNHEYGCDYDKQTEECRTVNDALALIEHLEAKVPRWISVEDQPEPPRDGEYWCYGYWIGSGRKQAETAQYLCGEWKIVNNFVLTHWMPLPEPPKEE